VNPFLAKGTGFAKGDLEILWESLRNAFQFDQSAARPAGSMAARRLIVFEHDSELGSAPSHRLLEAVAVKRRSGVDVPRSSADYEVSVDKSAIPSGVSVQEMIV
jgi:CRISPR-associated protein Csd2